MKRDIIRTSDGSSTVFIPEKNETYHSKHGAVTESLHVYIESGFNFFIQSQGKKEVSILELGFGTGLNALLACNESEKKSIDVLYDSLEAFPLVENEISRV